MSNSNLQQHIDSYWPKLTCTSDGADKTLISLPNPYVVPSVDQVDGFVYKEQYYWDTYFIVRGLLVAGKTDLALGMVNNLLHLVQTYGYVPNGNRMHLLSRSQPPMLAVLIDLMIQNDLIDDDWLARAVDLAEVEYKNVWVNNLQPFIHLTDNGLSRYYDANAIHSLAEAESGWDQTPRFQGRCLDFNPVDLNSLLYSYEMLLGTHKDESYIAKAESRKQSMRSLLSRPDHALWADFDFVHNELSPVVSMASLLPVWLGLVDRDEADRMLDEALSSFSHSYGLTATLATDPDYPTQWVAPNGWPPLQIILWDCLQGLNRLDELKRLTTGWIDLMESRYQQKGHTQEKYNLDNTDQDPKPGLYPSQINFAWTHASYLIARQYST